MSKSIKKEWLTIKKSREGFLLVEILLSTSLFVLFLTAFAGVFYYGLQASVLAGKRSQATMVAEEGQEAVRSMKNSNFSSLIPGTHGLTYSGDAWSFLGSSDTDNGFTRQVTVTDVDSNRKDVTVTVTWPQTETRTGSISFSGRVTNWKTVLNLGEGLMVNAVVTNHGLSKTVSDFAPYKVGTTTVQLGTSTKFSAGTYTVTGGLDSNYTLTFSNDCNSAGQVTLTSSSSKLCTLNYEEKLAYVKLDGVVINHGGDKVIEDFAPFMVGGATVIMGATTSVPSGTHFITEASSTEYMLSFSGQCFTDGRVVVGSGESKTCTLTNEEVITEGGGGGSPSLSGLMIYGDGTNIPKYRTYNVTTDAFSAETNTFVATVGPTWIIKTAPNAHYALAGYYDSTGSLTVMCFDGTTWTQEFVAQSGGVGNRHRNDIIFEKTSGDALVVYSKGGTSGDSTRWGKMGYRTKPGNVGCGASNWSSESTLTPLRTTSDIMYVKMVNDRRVGSDLIALTWVDTNDDISAKIWNGSSWVNEPSAVSDTNVERISSSHDIENMDLAYESLSGDLMLVWSNGTGNNGTNGVRYRTCTGGIASCTWGAVTTPPTFLDDATTLDITPNLETDEIVFASIGNAGGDLQLGYWNGSSWTNTANADTSSGVPYTGSKLVTTGWLTNGSTTRSIVVYADLNSPNINWYTGNGGVFTRQTDFAPTPSIGITRGYMDIHMDPIDKSQLMFLTSDNAKDLFAKRLTMTSSSTFVWTNSDGGALEIELPQVISSPFSFSFWQQ